MERPSEEVWIQSLAEGLTDEQKAKIESEVFEQVFQGCLQDRSYMRSIVNGYLETLGPLERACEIAGGDRAMTAEILGFDVVTGEPSDG